MRKILTILKLHYEAKLSHRQIAQITKVSLGSINNYIRLFEQSDIGWPLSEYYASENNLIKKLNPEFNKLQEESSKIDMLFVHQELSRYKKLTLQLLYEELKSQNKMPYSYSNFALLYRKWLGNLPSYMRQKHKAGEKVFVDYSGDKIIIIDLDTNQPRAAEIFVGVLGASNYIYLEATWSQKLNDWIMAHVRMFEAFNGVPALVIPDNLKSGVLKASQYDPDRTPAYYEMLTHYNTTAMPTRVCSPKDKSKVEGGVLIIQRWILAKLRHEKIYGLAALNSRLKELMVIANNKVMKLYPESRLELFNKLDKPALKPLPLHSYIYKNYKKARVDGSYHFELLKHYYSVSYKLINKEVDIWYNTNTVEAYYQNECIAKHIYSNEQGGHSTIFEHMPKDHQAYLDLNKDKVQSWSRNIGKSCKIIVDHIFINSPHEEIACRRSFGFLKLSKKYDSQKLEQACFYAITNHIYNYKNIEDIIKANLTSKLKLNQAIIHHSNIRGSNYYH